MLVVLLLIMARLGAAGFATGTDELFFSAPLSKRDYLWSAASCGA